VSRVLQQNSAGSHWVAVAAPIALASALSLPPAIELSVKSAIRNLPLYPAILKSAAFFLFDTALHFPLHQHFSTLTFTGG
jgi:hypothetical protein